MKVKVSHITKIFPSRNKKSKETVTALDDFSFEIPDGKLVGLLGPSGCGKSTMLNVISGLEKPTSGRVYFGEDDVTDLPPEVRGVGLVFQNYALYPHMTVRKNIMFPLENLKGDKKLTKEQMQERVEQAAKLVQITDFMERKPSQMSGGQQQRVAIARALVKLPGILLLDEPLSNLDGRLRLQTREELRRIQRETGITTVFVTHDQEEAMSISDMIVVMKDGVLNQVGKPQEIYDDPVNLFVAKFLGTPPINVFRGRLAGGRLMIGSEPVLEAKAAPDREVWIGVRPEGFIPAEDGELTCSFVNVEVMGRDTTVVSTHPDCENASIRSIISSDLKVEPKNGSVKFRLKPHKVHLFDAETEERLRTELLPVGEGREHA